MRASSSNLSAAIGRLGGTQWTALVLGLLSLAGLVLVPDPLHARAVFIGSLCLALWLTELVPPFVPTLLLLVVTPLLLAPFGSEYAFSAVLTWVVDPVLALFLGGFAMGAAATRHGLDAAFAQRIVTLSRRRMRVMIALVLGGTALMSMWMSNIAAAAMMLTALRPILRGAPEQDERFRTALLLSIAMGGNLGGMATPIGTGPNGIAIAAAAPHRDISFVSWMGFGVPLVVGMLLLAYALLLGRYRVTGTFAHEPPVTVGRSGRSTWVVGVFALAVAGWLTESLHGLSAPLIALAATGVLFGTGLLEKADLGRLDWSTLGLIAGGICVGRLLEHTGVFAQLAQQVDWSSFPRIGLIGALVVVAALLSALMSNTGTAAMLIPLAMSLSPTPSTAVIVAIATSFGVPFTISTPPNAMAYSEGGLKTTDLLFIGLPIMIVGCIVVTLTGTTVLNVFGLP